MREAKKLFETLNATIPFESKYPELFKKGNEVKILYSGTMLNKSGIYRAMLPKCELTGNGYNVIVHHIVEDYQNKQFIDNYELRINKDLIAWADYVILPPLTQDISFLIKDIKRVNKNAVICLDLEKNYHKLPNKSNDAVYYDVAKQKVLLSNISKCDILIVPDESVLEFYDKELRKYHPNTNLEVSVIPNFVSFKYQFQDVVKTLEENPPVRNNSIFTVMIYAENPDYDDVNSNRDILVYLQKTYPQTKIVLFGDTMNWKDRNALREIRHEFVPRKNHYDYLTQIARINPDVCFIPISHRDDYYRTDYKFLELSALGVPIITYNVHPYSLHKDILLIGEKKKDVKEIFDDVITNRQKLEAQGEKAHKYVWGDRSFNEKSLEIFSNCYFSTIMK